MWRTAIADGLSDFADEAGAGRRCQPISGVEQISVTIDA